MKKKIICIGVIGMFLLISIAGFTVSGTQISNTNTTYNENEQKYLMKPLNTDNGETIEEITLEDDAFHETNDFYHAETWYFDAVFTNEYSMATISTIVQKGDAGEVLTGLYIYKNTDLIYRPRTICGLDETTYSTEQLDMTIADETIMKCDVDPSTGQWNYYVYEKFDDVELELSFTNMAPGFRTDITGGWWLVQPRLEVHGWIKLEGELINVVGEGYHDHNWFLASTPFIQEGWHFGNIAGDDLGLTWANVMKNNNPEDSIFVINQKGKKPIQIHADDVKITIDEYMWNEGIKTPKDLTLEVNTNDVQVFVRMKTLNTNHVALPLLNYWRYHLKLEGYITVGDTTEQIDTVGISELMKFYRLGGGGSKNIENDDIAKTTNPLKVRLTELFTRIQEKLQSSIGKVLFPSLIYK